MRALFSANRNLSPRPGPPPGAAPVGARFLAQPQSGLRADWPWGHPGSLTVTCIWVLPDLVHSFHMPQQWQRWPLGHSRAGPGQWGPLAARFPGEQQSSLLYYYYYFLLLIVICCGWSCTPSKLALGTVLPGVGASSLASLGTCWEHRSSDPLQTSWFNRLPGPSLCSVKLETRCSRKHSVHKNSDGKPSQVTVSRRLTYLAKICSILIR